jgi:hypothetical protein
MNILRQRAGSPNSFPADPVEADLPSTSTTLTSIGEAGASAAAEKFKKQKAREEKRAKKQKERLDFDFPSDAKRREERREKAKMKEKGGVEVVEEEDSREVEAGGSGSGHGNGRWEDGGHVNFWADLEKNVSALRSCFHLGSGHPSTDHVLDADLFSPQRNNLYPQSMTWPRSTRTSSQTHSPCTSADRTRRPSHGILIGSSRGWTRRRLEKRQSGYAKGIGTFLRFRTVESSAFIMCTRHI